MKIFLEKQYSFPAKIIFSLSILMWLGSCINECDTRNGYVLGLQLDSAFRPYAIKYALLTSSNDTVYKTIGKGSTAIIPINISKTSTSYYLSSYETDTSKTPRKDSIVFGYRTEAFSRGPECGMDVRIRDITILNHSFDTAYFVKKVITSDTSINVKVNLNF